MSHMIDWTTLYDRKNSPLGWPVNLSDSVTNYRYIEIVYTNDSKTYTGMCKFDAQFLVGKRITFDLHASSGTNQLYINTATAKVTDATTIDFIGWRELLMSSPTSGANCSVYQLSWSSTGTDSHLFIAKVVGYK